MHGKLASHVQTLGQNIHIDTLDSFIDGLCLNRRHRLQIHFLCEPIYDVGVHHTPISQVSELGDEIFIFFGFHRNSGGSLRSKPSSVRSPYGRRCPDDDSKMCVPWSFLECR